MTGIETETKIEIPGYKIIKPIGSGGMATVYLALQESIDREVAIKAMSPALASDPSFSERFVKEARMATLSHPNIITVYDAGVSNGQNYIVMELATGGNLDTAIQNGLSAARVVEIIKSIASALHYSCKKGFIHRDVKPENILFKEDGSALLVDFGIAKAISSGTR
ncbi:MAG: serine/threonine protein kinase, partial [Gammaproteobacteria bacterium]|nr:serine/threonine protein kinase [Gammaproteobacteria bacterium]